jgi:hypothetical protein
MHPNAKLSVFKIIEPIVSTSLPLFEGLPDARQK